MSSNPSWITRFGFARTPFGKAIPASDLFSRPSHEEAVARVRFCVQERLMGVIVGGLVQNEHGGNSRTI